MSRGKFLIAREKPGEEERARFENLTTVLLPDAPYNIEFEMEPAARLIAVVTVEVIIPHYRGADYRHMGQYAQLVAPFIEGKPDSVGLVQPGRWRCQGRL